MSSGSSSSARSSPSSGKFQSSSQSQHGPHQQYPLEASDNFVIPGQHLIRHPPGGHLTYNHASPGMPTMDAIHYQGTTAAGARRSSDSAESAMHRPSSAVDDMSGPPMAAKPGRRFSLAQALSNINHPPSGSLSKSLSKAAKGNSGNNVSKERKDSVLGPLQSETNANNSTDSRPRSPTGNDRPGGRKGSTTSITSSSTSSKANPSNGAGKRRQSRIAFFSHRLGSEAIPDMKSLSINQTSGGKNQEHHFLPNFLSGHHENRKPTETYRLVVLGGSRVGKTAIVQRFLYNTFPETHSATVEELHRADYEVKGLGIVGVEILDTSGSFPFPAMQRLAISSGHAFILVYAIDDKESFEEVARLRELVISVKSAASSSDTHSSSSSSAQRSLGNKKGAQNATTKMSSNKVTSTRENDRGSSPDSIDSNNPGNSSAASNQVPLVIVANKKDLDEEERQVLTEMAECECIDWDVAFVESSAKSNDNIMNIFHTLLLQAHLKGILRSSAADSSSAGKGTGSPSKLKVEKVPKVSNRRRSSLPVNDLFHSTARHLPLFGGGRGGKGDADIKEGEVTHSASGGCSGGGALPTSPTTSGDGGHSSGRSSCALS